MNITENNQLQVCCFMYNLAQIIGTGNINISGNGSNCTSMQSVANSCGVTYCGQSGQTTVIDSQTELDNIVGCTDLLPETTLIVVYFLRRAIA